jgi:hypothetical protein
MSNPSGPDQDGEQRRSPDREDVASEAATEVTEVHPEPATEVLTTQNVVAEQPLPEPTVTPEERRFTAPSGMDAGSTQIIDRAPEPATEIFNVPGDAASDSTANRPPQGADETA